MRKYIRTLPVKDSTSVACMSAADPPEEPLAPEVMEALDTMLQDEYHAESVYRRVLSDFGDVRPFFNVIRAERRHSAAIALLYENRGLPVPESQWSPEDVPSYDTLREACAAALQEELANVALYDRFLSLRLPEDVRLTFEYNRRASLENHIPAFERCIARS